jgi:short-subunit dehydrogenase
MKTIAIVTGASSGIGKEFFLSLKEKAPLDEIWVVARGEEKLKALQTECKTPIRIFPLDLSKTESSITIENALKEEEIEIQYLICASGFGRFSSVEEDDSSVLQNMIDLNCRSIVGVTAVALPYLSKGSAVLLIASVAAFQPIPYLATYGATKAFVLSYGRALNQELKKSCGARCMCVCPFWTKTAFFDRATAEKTVVKKYVAMYEPTQIVTQAWKDLKRKNRDFSIYGAKAKGQVWLVKTLPHKLVMSVWQKQQGL